MKSITTPRLLALAVAIPRILSSYAAVEHPPPYSNAFVHRTDDPSRPSFFVKNQLHNLNKFTPMPRSNALKSQENVSTRRAMSSSPMPSSSQRVSPSPWSPGKWKLTLDFGREKSESSQRSDNSLLSNVLGEEWGSNGGRMVLSFEVMATAETNTREDDNSVQAAWLGGKPTGTVECIPRETNNGEEYCASYISEKGQQHVQISPGQWRIEPPLPLLPSYTNVLPGQTSTLRFYLTLLTCIRKNTISFRGDQMLLLQSNTFRTEQYSSGAQTLLPFQYAKDTSQQKLEAQLNHETGDRRLDGNDLFETLGGYKDVAELVLERDEKRRKWKEIEGVLPKLDSSIGTSRRMDANKLLEDKKRWGIWPGDTKLMTIERGVVLAVVVNENKKKKGLFPWMRDGGGVEEPVVVGKWSATRGSGLSV